MRAKPTALSADSGLLAPTLAPTAKAPLTARCLMVAIGLAAFGPYVTGSIRTEQIVVYCLAVLAFVVCIQRFRAHGGTPLLVAWCAYVVVGSLALLQPLEGARFAGGNPVAGLDNVLLPLAVMVVVWCVVPVEHAREMLRFFLAIFTLAVAANAILALASTASDLSALLRPFWATADAITTTAGNAASNGRFSGIFNQPAEAGFMYSLAGFAAVYLWRDRLVLQTAVILAVSIGGILCVSKIFVYGGLPLLAIYWLVSQRRAARFSLVIAAPLVALSMLQLPVLANWSGAAYFLRLFDLRSTDLVTLVSAGRAGEGSFVAEVVGEVLEVSPLIGVGVGGWSVPYDSVFAEVIVVGGVAGLGIYLFVLLVLIRLASTLRATDRMFGLAFVALVVGGGLGFSPLTANRSSTVAWVIICLMVLMQRMDTAIPPRSAPIERDRVRTEEHLTGSALGTREPREGEGSLGRGPTSAQHA